MTGDTRHSVVHPLAEATDVARIGGKAANLGKLIRAGFPVPGGFVVDTAACFHDARAAILEAYEAMGGGRVAVRSSATAEDAADASMAGQYDTFLNITGGDALLNAIARCRESLRTPRAVAYLTGHGLDPATVGMAVVVQRQIEADAAGVLFTAAPDDAYPRQMLIDAAWGLGESVVSGRVQPDVLRVAFGDGAVIDATIATKRVELTHAGERDVDPGRQNRPCLTGRDVHALWQLGRRAEAYFGGPQDLEWAVAGGQLYLLQSRPITTHADAAEAEAAITDAREQVKAASVVGGGPWVLHNLAETLPRPTPLTWSVIRRFMSAEGGYGTAHRRAGFAPAGGEFLDLIGCRVYMDAARAPRMFAADFPFAYDAATLRRSPDASQHPPTLPTGSAVARLCAGRGLRRASATLRRITKRLELRLRNETFVALGAYVANAKQTDLSGLSTDELLVTWTRHEARVMDAFGPDEILAGLAAGMALDDLRAAVAEHVWDADAEALAGELSSGGPADASLTADAALHEVGAGRRSLDDWLASHGHRGVGEFDLASPRWRERPDAARVAAERLAAAGSPAARHDRHQDAVELRRAEIRQVVPAADRHAFDRFVDAAQRAVVLREDAKDALMLGYDLLRDVALECGRRLDVGDSLFHLSREELFAAVRIGYAPIETMERRRRRHAAERGLRLPAFIDASALPGDVRPVAIGGALPISAGVATGPARIVVSPDDATVLPGDVLICPSTDPAWTPLLAGAAALVIECGGVLSHGAVVAREMGVPAVVLPDATRRFKTGDVLRVDGTTGYARLAAEEATATVSADDTRLPPAMLPPPVGAIDRRAARLRNVAAAGWGALLLGFFLLPDRSVRRPSLAAFDSIFWPLHRMLGWPMTVAIIAIITATATLMLQRTMTDNRRLLEGKRRATVLKSAAADWPVGSPRHVAMTRAAAGMPGRVLGASLVPVGLLLGPMVVGFIWLGERAEPAAWNAPAGSAVRIVATVDGEYAGPVRLELPAGVTADESTPIEQTPASVRATLERLLTLYRQPRPAAGEPWELSVAPDVSRRQTADDLAAYLAAELPAQSLTWLVHPGETFDRRFSVGVSALDCTTDVNVTVGPSRPPSPSVEAGAAGSAVRAVKVVYPPPKVARSFLKLAGVDVGWLGVYVAAYVAALVAIRRVANVA